jgi:anti-sigma regulatory factor (Ser/Thr protein kinase)
MVLTANTSTLRICVKDDSYIGAARRAIRVQSADIGLGQASLDKLDILSTELSSNLCKYGQSGREILVINASVGDTKGVTLVSVDRGPGIADIDKALVDGISSGQTLGAGLGSLKRVSDSFDICSSLGKGTIVICTVYQSGTALPRNTLPALFDRAWITVPHPAEQVCGDGLSVCASDQSTSIVLVDGLGHGAGAADAARIACNSFEQFPFEDCRKIVERINTELSCSRGAALAVTRIDQQRNKLTFVGVGNISSRVYSSYSSTGCVSTQGIVGAKIGTLAEYTYEWAAGSVLLMHSDGIKSSAALESGKPRKSALMLAAEIYRDFYRGNDDATVFVSIDKRSR